MPSKSWALEGFRFLLRKRRRCRSSFTDSQMRGASGSRTNGSITIGSGFGSGFGSTTGLAGGVTGTSAGRVARSSFTACSSAYTLWVSIDWVASAASSSSFCCIVFILPDSTNQRTNKVINTTTKRTDSMVCSL